MFYSDDPVADYESYTAQQERELGKIPKCSECGNHIQDEMAYLINDELICERCMNGFKVHVDDYI